VIKPGCARGAVTVGQRVEFSKRKLGTRRNSRRLFGNEGQAEGKGVSGDEESVGADHGAFVFRWARILA